MSVAEMCEVIHTWPIDPARRAELGATDCKKHARHIRAGSGGEKAAPRKSVVYQ
jgi:hypothetical protein